MSCTIMPFTSLVQEPSAESSEEQERLVTQHALLTTALDKRVAITDCLALQPLGVLCQSSGKTAGPAGTHRPSMKEKRDYEPPPWGVKYVPTTLNYEAASAALVSLAKKLEQARANKEGGVVRAVFGLEQHSQEKSFRTSKELLSPRDDCHGLFELYDQQDDMRTDEFEGFFDSICSIPSGLGATSKSGDFHNVPTSVMDSHKSVPLRQRQNELSDKESKAAARLAAALEGIGADAASRYRDLARGLEPDVVKQPAKTDSGQGGPEGRGETE